MYAVLLSISFILFGKLSQNLQRVDTETVYNKNFEAGCFHKDSTHTLNSNYIVISGMLKDSLNNCNIAYVYISTTIDSVLYFAYSDTNGEFGLRIPKTNRSSVTIKIRPILYEDYVVKVTTASQNLQLGEMLLSPIIKVEPMIIINYGKPSIVDNPFNPQRNKSSNVMERLFR